MAMCSLRNSAWHHMRNIALIDRCFDGMIYGRQQERERRYEKKGEETDNLSKPYREEFGDRYIKQLERRGVL